MSEQAKIAYVQEKINEAKSHERYGTAWIVIAAAVAVLSFVFAGESQSLVYIGILGILIAIFSFAFSSYYAFQRIKLTQQLKTIATEVLTCPKCGKEVPKADYVFCPFCSSALHHHDRIFPLC